MDRYRDYNNELIRLGLSNACGLGNHVPCTIIFIFFVYLVLKNNFFAYDIYYS